MAQNQKKTNYLAEVIGFYFAPALRSFFTVFYLIFFAYFIVFYFDNLVLSVKFIIYTVGISTVSLNLEHLFWGAIFIISLIIPFAVSFYAIFIPFEINRVIGWDKTKKLLLTALVLVATVDMVILMDNIIKIVETQDPISIFMERQDLPVKN